MAECEWQPAADLRGTKQLTVSSNRTDDECGDAEPMKGCSGSRGGSGGGAGGGSGGGGGTGGTARRGPKARRFAAGDRDRSPKGLFSIASPAEPAGRESGASLGDTAIRRGRSTSTTAAASAAWIAPRRCL